MNRHLENVPTLPRVLKELGYLSLQTGKWWQGHYSRGGFTHGMTQGQRHGDRGLDIGRKTMQPIYDFVELAQKEHQPFFVWYAPMLPHQPHFKTSFYRGGLTERIAQRVQLYLQEDREAKLRL